MKIQEFKNKKITILGFGKEGQGSLKFLQKIGVEDITVLDQNPIEECEVPCITGDGYLDNISEYDVVIKTPGITPFQDKLEPYRDKFISQTSIFFANYTGKVIAITGTKGKSTTSTLLYESLKESGYNVKLVGNIGKPVLDEIDILSSEAYDYVVYEMSSYMLQDFEPNTYLSVFNNVYRCHIDWHGSFDVYKKAKIGILTNAEHRIINSEFKNDITLTGEYFGLEGKYQYKDDGFYIGDERILEDTGILLEGEHNRKNISAVLGILDIIIGDNSKISEVLSIVLQSFSGLPHRMERIGEYKGITFVNDAIATTPESTMAALKTFTPGVGTLFLGGADSGFIYNELEAIIEQYQIPNLVLFPDTGYKIFSEQTSKYKTEQDFVIKKSESYSPNILKTKSMKKAVQFAYDNTKVGDIVLLSCASQSFSLWKSFIIKGEEFTRYVKEYGEV